MSKETSIEPNRTVVPAESSSSFPADLTDGRSKDATMLVEWLGSFWTEVYEDPEFIEYLQDARALRIAQLYLDLLENLRLEDRSNAPVFHRERWHPIVLRRSQAGTGSKSLFRLVNDGTLVLGEQTDPVYPPGTVVTLGGEKVDLEGMVLYPLDRRLKSVLTCISNNIADASVVLSAGSDFAVLDGAIAISKDCDPFTGSNADRFPKFEVVAENPEDNDVETVLWGCDSMFDDGLLYRNVGYALALPSASTETMKRTINAVWNAVSSGCTPLLLRSMMACICGLPTVIEEGEVVSSIVDEDGETVVITDRNAYRLPVGSVLRKDVFVGASLSRFDTLDMAIRVYPFTTDPSRLPLYNEFVSELEDFVKDLPAIDLPPAFFDVPVKEGFSVDWNEVPVELVGYDSNGNPKLRFPLEGSESDENAFWEAVWDRYEAAGRSMAECFGFDVEETSDGVVGTVRPIEFFLRNLVGSNTLVVTVRSDTVSPDAPLYDPKFFGALRSCIPSYVRLLAIEHASVPDDRSDLAGAYDEADIALHDDKDDNMVYNARTGAGFSDGVSFRWVAACE